MYKLGQRPRTPLLSLRSKSLEEFCGCRPDAPARPKSSTPLAPASVARAANSCAEQPDKSFRRNKSATFERNRLAGGSAKTLSRLGGMATQRSESLRPWSLSRMHRHTLICVQSLPIQCNAELRPEQAYLKPEAGQPTRNDACGQHTGRTPGKSNGLQQDNTL